MKTLAALALLAPALVFANPVVGKVSEVEGHADRIRDAAGSEEAAPGTPVVLSAGNEIELKDRLRVDEKGSLKLKLNDGSVVALGPGSVFDINEGDFQDQVRQGFSAKLWFGHMWAKVSKALSSSGGKFEVSTDRAVAGVRGTIFRIDTGPLITHAFPPKTRETTVRVNEGVVAVDAKVKNGKCTGEQKPQKGKRHQVAGPHEVTKEEWEQCFVALQSKQQVKIGEAYWKTSEFDPGDRDAFEKFAEKGE
jgi:hypothetical protein